MLNALRVGFGGFCWNANGQENLDHEPMARFTRAARAWPASVRKTPRKGATWPRLPF